MAHETNEPSASERRPLAGSERPLPSDEMVGEIDAAEPAVVSVYVRGEIPAPGGRTREELAEAFGAATADLEAVRAFAERAGLTVTDVDRARRRVELRASAGALAAAFGATLRRHRRTDGTTYRAQHGPVYLPDELHQIVTGVFGLDERRAAEPHFRPKKDATRVYSPIEVATAYAFPAGASGAGECIGLVELGGGFRTADLEAYFADLKVSAPSVTAISVDGATNQPGTPNGPDGEVMLDIEVAGAVAPGARIAVYFAPNTDQGFLDAVSAAVHDTGNRPSVISISWGSAESTWSAQAMAEMDRAIAAAAAIGVSVTVAAGDNGSSDGQSDGLAHVDFPASSPHALACGGTRLEAQGAVISSEVVWNDGPGLGATGGGVSAVFPVPSYQDGAGVPPSVNPGAHRGRGVPDVAGDADPDTGYRVQVDGEVLPIGGTSAVAPLWAGLIACLNQQLGRPVGLLQPFLYAKGASSLHDITSGSNGAYSAGPGWDACTGLGSPDGTALVAALRAAGT
ncbi:MAG: S53 family peptidase [Actinomycetota bacterium]|nr:S53 family peptidase [Actinomycetota bacterium]